MDYPGVRALADVSVAFTTGEIHALIGENGAGKSTLLKIMSGIQLPSAGSTSIDGNAVHLTSVKAAERAGIAMVHQELNLIETLSVAENICLGSEPNTAGFLSRSAMAQRAKAALEKLNAPIDPSTCVGDLPLASKQMVEIAKALAQEAKFLILDEPTAVLAERETDVLLTLLEKLRTEGVGVIYVSHRLEEVCRIADRITVLRDGVVAADLIRPPEEQTAPTIAEVQASSYKETVEKSLQSSPAITPRHLANLMVGRELEDLFPEKLKTHGDDVVLDLQSALFEGFTEPITLKLNAGEIVGLGGLIGSGRTEIAEGIIGKRRRLGGSVQAKEPAYVSEDRKGTGLHLSLELKDNVTMANLKRYGRFFVDDKKQIETSEGWIKSLGIRTPSARVFVQSLSGGNQQKVSLSKWLDCRPRLLILDEPTRGVDIGAKSEIYQLIHNLAQSGMGCLVISSEMNELIGLCDRVVVLRERKITGELNGKDVTESNIMMLAAGVANEAAV